MVDRHSKECNMSLQGRTDADPTHKPSNSWKKLTGPGSYEVHNFDMEYILQQKQLQNSPIITDPLSPKSKNNSMMTNLSFSKHDMSTAGSKIRTRVPKKIKKLFKLFMNEDKEMRSLEDSPKYTRLNITATGTEEGVGPGKYDIEKETIAKKLEDWLERKRTFSIRNNYQNYIFPVKMETREDCFTETVADQLHLSTQIKQKRFLGEPLAQSDLGKQNDSQSDYVKSKIMKLGALYEKTKLRETIQKGKIAPGFREYRASPVPYTIS